MEKKQKDSRRGRREDYFEDILVIKQNGERDEFFEDIEETEIPEEKYRISRTRILFLAAEIILLLFSMAFFYGTGLLTRMNSVNGREVEQQVQSSIHTRVQHSTESGSLHGYRNIALFGVDSREDEIRGNTRSDSLMVASINQDTGDIKLVSVYRDTYLNLGNGDYSKCNAAYAAGGPEQAIRMLNMNLDLNITDFVTVGFHGLIDAIDALGGVDIDVDAAEVRHLNSYVLSMSKEIGTEYEEVKAPGHLHLNGTQATAYCRIRYTEGDDFQRAARQREVLRNIFEKAKTANPVSVSRAAEGILSQVYTSLSAEELVALIPQVLQYNLAAENTDDKYGSGFPTMEYRGGGYVGAQSVVIPEDLESNVVWLHHFLFGEEDYVPSSTVRENSQHIVKVTGKGKGGISANAPRTPAVPEKQPPEPVQQLPEIQPAAPAGNEVPQTAEQSPPSSLPVQEAVPTAPQPVLPPVPAADPGQPEQSETGTVPPQSRDIVAPQA